MLKQLPHLARFRISTVAHLNLSRLLNLEGWLPGSQLSASGRGSG
jgi:hypothetical protein